MLIFFRNIKKWGIFFIVERIIYVRSSEIQVKVDVVEFFDYFNIFRLVRGWDGSRRSGLGRLVFYF